MADLTRADLMDLSDRLGDKMDALAVAVARLEAMQATEAERCPFREEVAQIPRLGVRLEKIEGRVDKLELTWAKAVGLVLGSGGIASVVTQLLQRIW